MPELAEVESFRRRWAVAGTGARVVSVELHPAARVFRGADPDALRRALVGARLRGSETAAKQMLFRFTGGGWLGLHLGMSGDLSVAPPDQAAGRHDHLVLRTRRHALIFSDPRMSGRVNFAVGRTAPEWWTRIAPAILSPHFTVSAVAQFLQRRRRSPIKAVLLMQERFPGVGNWMADEILWRAAIHPRQPAGSLTPSEVRRLHTECRRVCRLALRTIAVDDNHESARRNARIPRSWLLPHRWRPGGRCPLTGKPLAHATIGGRTTCWSPARQKRHRP